MGRVQDAICDALAAEIMSRTEWDELPEVLTVYYSGGRGHLRQVLLPDWVWFSGPPAQVLEGIADAGGASAELLQMTALEGLYGAAFFTEIWMASAPHGSAAAEDLVRRAKAAGGRVSTLPERVEARCIWAVDRTGTTYSVFQCRGETKVKRAVSYPKAGEGFTGAVPRALDRLVTAFLSVTLPERGRA